MNENVKNIATLCGYIKNPERLSGTGYKPTCQIADHMPRSDNSCVCFDLDKPELSKEEAEKKCPIFTLEKALAERVLDAINVYATLMVVR